MNETGAQSLDDALFQSLTERAVLLVLDNFEHLLPAAPRLSDLLATTDVHLVVTSRAALRLSGEYEWPVPPLALPPPVGARCRGAVAVRRRRAVRRPGESGRRRLRAQERERAGRRRRSACASTGCRSRSSWPRPASALLPPEAILDRLEQRFSLLTSGPRDLPSRQQTLRGAMDWSYDLLAPSEQRLFARLAVFAGGCLLEAAEEVCDAGLDDLEALLQNNLLRQEDRPTGDRRFRMLETIREYAVDRLDELGERERAAHAPRRVGARRRRGAPARAPRGDGSSASGSARATSTRTSAPRSPGRATRARSSWSCASARRSPPTGASAATSARAGPGSRTRSRAATRRRRWSAPARCSPAPACPGGRTTRSRATATRRPRTRSSSQRASTAAPPRR